MGSSLKQFLLPMNPENVPGSHLWMLLLPYPHATDDIDDEMYKRLSFLSMHQYGGFNAVCGHRVFS